ncbi:hypothetical protein MA16_Dca018441 [Dendrobium catenatum]|uniref:Uncharacterized protein n=1 Tax=Dendrobium catenatum TaxID=906689 RepID=A0A2I0XF94_9ASPA|nr:hypothetical protein MA16_Dca018441 [Dendrobium catenatum]
MRYIPKEGGSLKSGNGGINNNVMNKGSDVINLEDKDTALGTQGDGNLKKGKPKMLEDASVYAGVRCSIENVVNSFEAAVDVSNTAKGMTELKDPKGNLEIDSTQDVLFTSANKFELLNSLCEEGNRVEIQDDSKEEDTEEGELVEILEDFLTSSKGEASIDSFGKAILNGCS